MPNHRHSCRWCLGRSLFDKLKSPRRPAIRRPTSTTVTPMLHSGLAAWMISLWVVFWSDGAFALDRAALALSGSECRLSHQDIIETLERLEGVTRVEAETI